jgi:NAD(P)-dependent dehydrogenase (short-subunit alcohol dehydrogenase family)
VKLKNQVALVTGGSRGIGKSIARSFLMEGAYVVICARNKNDVESTQSDFTKSGLNKTFGMPIDVSHPNQVKTIFEKTESLFGPVDILVNAAGTQTPYGFLVDTDDQDWISCVQTNLIGTMLCTKYALRSMVSRKQGKILNFSGGGSFNPRPYFSAYASSKAAVVRFTETIAEEVLSSNINVNAIAPGPVDTQLFAEALSAKERIGEKNWTKMIALKERGINPPEFVCDLALFLVSNESDWISGKVISAPWDDWKNLETKKQDLVDSSLLTMRRIDGRNFFEKKDSINWW